MSSQIFASNCMNRAKRKIKSKVISAVKAEMKNDLKKDEIVLIFVIYFFQSLPILRYFFSQFWVLFINKLFPYMDWSPGSRQE